jgi:hypothetical protein
MKTLAQQLDNNLIKGIDFASDVLHACTLCGLQLIDDFHVSDSVC